MGASMIHAVRTYNKHLVIDFIETPEIWEVISEDGQERGTFRPEVEQECWLAMHNNDGTVVALYNFHAVNGITVEIHAHVLPEYRKEHSAATCLAAFRWMYDNEPECNKIIANVPNIYENVKNFAVRMGFSIEGVNRSSYRKNGGTHDQWSMGITRDEIKELIWGK